MIQLLKWQMMMIHRKSKNNKRWKYIPILSTLLEGGKQGVENGYSYHSGVLIVCTCSNDVNIQMPVDGYTGAAYRRCWILTMVGRKD